MKKRMVAGLAAAGMVLCMMTTGCGSDRSEDSAGEGAELFG